MTESTVPRSVTVPALAVACAFDVRVAGSRLIAAFAALAISASGRAGPPATTALMREVAPLKPATSRPARRSAASVDTVPRSVTSPPTTDRWSACACSTGSPAMAPSIAAASFASGIGAAASGASVWLGAAGGTTATVADGLAERLGSCAWHAGDAESEVRAAAEKKNEIE